jgi:superfamily I DNA/RNA helicase
MTDTIETTRPFTPSAQQARFFEWVEAEHGSAALIAVAGAGKTTTLIQALKRMQGNVFLGAYNRSAADDMKAKATAAGAARRGLFISTFHGAGNTAWMRAYPKCQLSKHKVDDIISTITDNLPTTMEVQNWETQRKFINKMVSIGKQFLMGVVRDMNNTSVWLKLIEHFQADEDLEEGVDLVAAVARVAQVSQQSMEMCPTIIDFDDMIFAPIAYNLRMFKNDWVLIDEAQDSNVARRELAKRMLKAGGRLVAVGDPRQAIYGFQGAGSDSLERIMQQFNCIELPLTTTYRCPKSVVKYVQQWVSHIQAADSAPEGEVVHYRSPKPPAGEKVKPWFLVEQPTANDAVLCRYTKPLVDLAFKMIRNGIPCKMEGRDIGQGLIQMATRWKVKTLDALENKLATWQAKELDKAEAKRNEDKAQSIIDKCDTLRVFIERCRAKGSHSVDCVVLEIQDLFADNVKGILTLCSGHRSKGREWATVYWIRTELRTRRDLLPWEVQQEANINYVMGTRAMERLVLLQETTP